MHKVQQFNEVPLKEPQTVVLELKFNSIDSQRKFNSLQMKQMSVCTQQFALRAPAAVEPTIPSVFNYFCNESR